MSSANAEGIETIKIPAKTFEFLYWLAKQDVTLPATLTHHLKWDRYPEKEIQNHLNILSHAIRESKVS